MKVLSIDTETFSSADLQKCGTYRYCEADDFEILLFGYSVDGGDVHVIDLAQGETLPDDVKAALTDEHVLKTAFNAQFERVCLSRYLGLPTGEYLPPEQWRCTMIWSAYLGLPLSLMGVGAVLGLDKQKLDVGKDLIRYFCKPCAPTAANGQRTRNLRADAPGKWALFKTYNLRDVETECEIQQKLSGFPVPNSVWREYWQDQEINDRGIALDMTLVENAIRMDAQSHQELTDLMRKLTDLENPNSVQQMKRWLAVNGLEVESLGKKQVAELLKDAPKPLGDVLSLRQQLAKSSVKKYQAMEAAVCADGRTRGMFQFYGANRTGRFCLTGDHEVLTDEGWKRLDAWQGGRIACWNADTEAVSFQAAQQVCFDYDGPMYTYRDSRIDQCSTPDHKMRVQRRYGGIWEDMTVEEMAKHRPAIPMTGYGYHRGCADPKPEWQDATWQDAHVLDNWLKPRNGHVLKNKPTIAEFHGQVYCAVTPTGYFLVRRNGKVWVTGNSGRLIQLQNLPQNHMPDLEDARELVKTGDYDAVRMLYGSVPDVLSELIRTAFVPKEGAKFIVADFSAIEARVIAWLAQEDWRTEVFKNGGDIYCASASQMFHVPVVKHGVNGHLQQKGKISELALGYGGSVGALKAMGALDMGLKEEELPSLVAAWRSSNPNIVQFWWDVDDAAMTAVSGKTCAETHGILFEYRSGMLFVTLPSGRRLAYVKPRIGENQFGSPAVTYMGTGGTKKWERLETYGPKLVENCIAKDTLVITSSGLIPIQHVTPMHRIWDGIEYVMHDGLMNQGEQDTIDVNGIHMTPNHKILTEEGWVPCGEAEGLIWKDISLPNGYVPRGEYKARQDAVAMPVCMRKSENNFRKESNSQTKPGKIMWLHEDSTHFTIESDTWYEPPSSICGLALNEPALRKSKASCIQELWRSRNNGVRRMAEKLHRILGRHGANLPIGFRYRPNQQQWRLLQRKLSLDHKENQQSKQAKQQNNQYTLRKDDSVWVVRADEYPCNNTALSAESQMADRITVHKAGYTEQVYDIRNCGPRHRFAVWDSDAKKCRVVSNCVQAISRDILCYAMNTLRCYSIVAHVHDEVIIEADPHVSLEAICEQMGRTPPWAEGLILRADGYETKFYKKS